MFYNEPMFRLPAVMQAEYHSNNKGNAYMYYWKEESKIPLFKACHAVELAYVFNNIKDTIYTGEKADADLANKVSTMWVNFAKTGNPSLDDVIWNKYDAEDRKTLEIAKDKIIEVNDPLKKRREALAPLVNI